MRFHFWTNSRRPSSQTGKLPLQLVVVLILGGVLVATQLALQGIQAFQQKRDIEEVATKRALSTLKLLTTLQTQAMLNRLELKEADPAIQTFTGALEHISSSNDGVAVWVVMGPKVQAYQERVGAQQWQPRDDVDRQALADHLPVTTLSDSQLRISVPVVLGQGPASDQRCASCHTGAMGIETGELIGLYSVSIDLSSDYAAWRARFWRMLELTAMATLATLVLSVWLLRHMVISPLERLTAQTRVLAAGEDVEITTDTVRTGEIGELSDALVVFRNNLQQKRELEAQNALALRKLEGVTGSLDMALRSMTQGLCMFDKSQRLVLLNERLLEIFDIDEACLGRETTFSSLCELMVCSSRSVEQSGGEPSCTCSEMARRHYLSLTATGEPVMFEERFGDRVLSITHAMTTEGGWVTTVEDITLRREHEKHIAYLARFDTLTGLPNRAQFRDHLQMESEWALRNGLRLAAIVIDLNKFKEINDRRGHAVGDTVLAEVGTRLSAITTDGEFIARIGGDEFSAIKRFSSDVELGEFLTRVETCFGRAILDNGTEISVSCSIGVAILPVDASTPEQLVNNADLAMYRAKRSVNHSICFYEAAMDEAARERRLLAHDLWAALAADEFHLTYQVQKSVSTQETTGYEALLRWTHPVHGPISPETFIPVAEECGAILPIGQWVLKRACMDAAKWRSNHRVAVNLSPIQIANDDVVALVRQTLIDSGLSPSRLELEITESTIIGDKRHALHVLRQLKALGVSIAIDDFGTGYSSLDTLNSFPFDKIKIDRSFMMASDEKPESRAIVKAVLALGRSLSVPVLAEGVETESQLRLLEAEGCHEAQGFLFGRPVRNEARELTSERVLEYELAAG